jgi:hypothetical protein
VRLQDWVEGEGSDQSRHRCLVRWVIKRRIQDRNLVHQWLNGYTDDAGRHKKGWNEMHVGSILERDVRIQWGRGNRGNYGDWRENE